MRLKTEQITSIIEIVQAITQQPFQIRLFGSRLSDEAKDGDIDLCSYWVYCKKRS